MGCSDDRSIQVDHEETNQEQDNSIINEKVYEDFEEYKSKKYFFKNI